jgi:ABC-type sulfate transport system substrate-binding protein
VIIPNPKTSGNGRYTYRAACGAALKNDVSPDAAQALVRGIFANLWSDERQDLAAKHSLRPRSANVLAKYAKQFPKLRLFTVDEPFGGRKKAQKDHFDDGGLYEQIVASAKR